MTEKIQKDKRTYAIQCSKCKKIMLPQAETKRRKLRQLVILEDLTRDWVLGKINIFSEIPNSVRKFIEESIRGGIENYVFDVVLDESHLCNCKDNTYRPVRCSSKLTMEVCKENV